MRGYLRQGGAAERPGVLKATPRSRGLVIPQRIGLPPGPSADQRDDICEMRGFAVTRDSSISARRSAQRSRALSRARM